MQSLACPEVHLAAEHARDGGGALGAEGFLRGPERLGLVGGFDQRQAWGGEAERVEARAMRAAAAHELLRGKQEQQRRFLRHAAEEGEQEAEGRWQVGFRRRRNLVQRAEGEPTVRQMAVERRDSEGERRVLPLRHTFQAGKVRAERLNGGFASRFL